jgi:hypothetical protein
MSYDMYFWRQTKQLAIAPEKLVGLLAEDSPVDGVIAFPRVQVREVLGRHSQRFMMGMRIWTGRGRRAIFKVALGMQRRRISI